MPLFIDRVHRLPRVWSNRELSKFAPLFSGDVVNVSAWKDSDKEGKRYREYFSSASTYTLTNFESGKRGFQGGENEIFLNLELEPDPRLQRRFDAVFNHTTLEHIYDVQTAFDNICEMSKDIVIIVLPFLQQYHTDYGDHWRFSPLLIKRMFEDRGFTLLYQSFNTHRRSSVYTFTIASRQPERWEEHFDWKFSVVNPGARGREPYIGCAAISNRAHRVARFLTTLFRAPRRAFREAWSVPRPDQSG